MPEDSPPVPNPMPYGTGQSPELRYIAEGAIELASVKCIKAPLYSKPAGVVKKVFELLYVLYLVCEPSNKLKLSLQSLDVLFGLQ